MKYIEVKPKTKEVMDKLLEQPSIMLYLQGFKDGTLDKFEIHNYFEEIWQAGGVQLDVIFYHLIKGDWQLKSNENWCVYVSNGTFFMSHEKSLHRDDLVRSELSKEEAMQLTYKLNEVLK